MVLIVELLKFNIYFSKYAEINYYPIKKRHTGSKQYCVLGLWKGLYC